MLSAEAEILRIDTSALSLLRAYREHGIAARALRARSAAEAAADEPADGSPDDESAESGAPFEIDRSDPWVPRISQMEDVETDGLAELHGRLIAGGFLTFQIRDRITGVEYRLTNAGKQFLTRSETEVAEDDSDHDGDEDRQVA